MDPVGHEPLIRSVVAGLQRDLAKPKKRKEHITPDILKQMVDSIGFNPSSRLLAITLLAFAAFLRFDEIVKIRCCDIQFKQEHMVVKIVSTNIGREMRL